ncbi:MAG TPA: RimK family alpha-L-glutamate ligase [Patescibacteria group bacterium]|nr:RimK family alpha-L-glutamate ligase [Patescibacteria group bacterium]
MKIGILADRNGWHVEVLAKALARRGCQADFLPITRLVARVPGDPLVTINGQPLESYDALLVRTIPEGSLEQIIFRMNALHRLEAAGVRIVNRPSPLERTVDKYYTSSLLASRGLPTPRTIVAEGFDEAMEAFRGLGDVVVKPLFGAGGRGMVRISDADIAYRVFRALVLTRSIFYIQEFVPHGDYDLRGLVIGDRVVASMRRRSDGWRHNVSLGAQPEPLAMDKEATSLCLEASRLLETDYAGIDLLKTDEGYTVVEVNSIPGWSGLQRTTEIDIAQEIADHLLSLLGRRPA